MSKQLSRSEQLGAKVIYTAMKILAEKEDGEAAGHDIINEVERQVNLDEWAKSTYEKSGYSRWRSTLHFYTIDMIKAGFLLRRKGIWYITPEGREALKLGEIGMLKAAISAYKHWKKSNHKKLEKISKEDEYFNYTKDSAGEVEQEQEATLQEVEQQAYDGIRERILRLNPYEFQDLVVALLRGMQYYTPFIAPRGKDGGIDIIAYQDPLGAISPRIKVQIKHRPNTASTVQEIRELIGLLGKAGDIGMFVSTGGFTKDAKSEALRSHVHVELIDLDRFISLWQDFYPQLNDEDKEYLKLRPVFFYDPAI